VTDTLGDGEPETEAGTSVRVPKTPLRGHPLGVEATSLGRRQEVGSFLEPLDRRHRWFDPGRYHLPRGADARGVRAGEDQASGRQALAAMGATARDDLAAAGGGHARTETVTALTDELARLVGSLHGSEPSKVEARSRAADAAPDLHASWLSANTKGAHAGRHVASGGLMADGPREVNVSWALMTLELHEGAHLDAQVAQALRAYRDARGVPAKLVVVGMTSTGFAIADPADAGMLDVVGFAPSTPPVIADFARA